jgi:hypothetical protein
VSGLKYEDVRSYLAALVFRKGRTIIVEGRTDKRALARAVHEFEREGRLPRGLVFVDSVDIVGGFQPGGLGAREKVELLHRQTRAAGHETFAFTDREFRNFVVTASEIRDELRAHNQPGADVVWTRGHSIENYFFELEYVQDFLRYRFCDRLNSSMIDGLREYWSCLLSQAAAYSVAARDMELRNRMCDAITIAAWHMPATGRVLLRAGAIEATALERGVASPEAARFAALFESLVPLAEACPDSECCRWIAHGHLGDQVIWTAVGALLLSAGADQDTATEVAHGRCEEKSYYRADRWGQLHRGGGAVPTPEPLWSAIGVSQPVEPLAEHSERREPA